MANDYPSYPPYNQHKDDDTPPEPLVMEDSPSKLRDRIRDLEASILYACDDSRCFVVEDSAIMTIQAFDRLMQAVDSNAAPTLGQSVYGGPSPDAWETDR